MRVVVWLVGLRLVGLLCGSDYCRSRLVLGGLFYFGGVLAGLLLICLLGIVGYVLRHVYYGFWFARGLLFYAGVSVVLFSVAIAVVFVGLLVVHHCCFDSIGVSMMMLVLSFIGCFVCVYCIGLVAGVVELWCLFVC